MRCCHLSSFYGVMESWFQEAITYLELQNEGLARGCCGGDSGTSDGELVGLMLRFFRERKAKMNRKAIELAKREKELEDELALHRLAVETCVGGLGEVKRKLAQCRP